MTAEGFTGLLQAYRTGLGRWLARCPVHGQDKHPSLAITQGEHGVLLRCWSHGCTPKSICTALGLMLRDLFDSVDLTQSERAEAAQKRQKRDTERKAEHHTGCQCNRELLRLECLRDSLGGLLARNPDDAEVARMFHRIPDKLTTLEVVENAPEDGPVWQAPLPESPAQIADALTGIGQDLDAKEKAALHAA